MKALIEQNYPVEHIASWTTETVDNVVINVPVRENISNSTRIAEVAENEFEVCPDSLFWVDCNTSVNTEDYYYDTSDSTIKPIVNANPPS